MPASAEATTTSGPRYSAIRLAAVPTAVASASEAPPNFQTCRGADRGRGREDLAARRRGHRVPHILSWLARRHRIGPAHYLASGSGRSWKCAASGLVPLPPSISHGVRSPLAAQMPLPFQPALGSSMRPSKPLA